MTSGPDNIDPRAAREAAQWLVRLRSGPLSVAKQQAWLAWRDSDPQHERAWQRAEKLSLSLGLLPPAAGMRILDRPQRQGQPHARRAAIKTLALLITAGPLLWGAHRLADGPQWGADARTAKGEIRPMTLADGTHIVLNTDTAIDIAYTAEVRLIRLRAGEIHVETAHDPHTPARPFFVQTGNGRIRALGTRFTVRQDGDIFHARTHVAVTEGAVEIVPALGQHATRIIAAGNQASFDAQAISATTAIAPFADAWRKGVLVADNMPLGTLLAQLARYRRGVLRCDPKVANIPVSGTFQLKDPDNILALLQRSLPIRLRYNTRFWINVDPG